MVVGPSGPGAARRYGGPITSPSSPPPPGPTADEAAVTEVVARFYAAFEARDLDAMSDVWVHDERASCTHPGWGALTGWAAVSASWFAIFDQSPPLQVFVTEERVHVAGDVAWVTVDENLLGAGAEDGGTTVSALKVLCRAGDGWRIVAHHGSVVVGRPD